VQPVAKYSTWDVLRRDWSEVGWDLSGRSEQQYKERYSVLTEDGDSADSARPLHYSKSDTKLARASALSTCYSLTHAHRSIGYRNRKPQPLVASPARLMYLRVYDSRDISRQTAPSPSLCYSLTHAHRSIAWVIAIATLNL
jgi:hypothetical protein